VNNLIEPHGGELCELIVSEEERKHLQKTALQYPSLTLNDRQLCDFEMLLNGGFSPLKGFLGKEDYDSVLAKNRLIDNTIWPIPITLDVSEEFTEDVIIPDYSDVANAIGASLAQAGGEIDKIYSYSDIGREKSLELAKLDAIKRAKEAGAKTNTISIIELEEIPLSYLPSGAVRLHVKAVGDLF